MRDEAVLFRLWDYLYRFPVHLVKMAEVAVEYYFGAHMLN